ncbi:protein kinase domain-containing protein [Planctomycetaceae bacterium SH139]
MSIPTRETNSLSETGQYVQEKSPERLAGRYEIRQKLGAGGMSTVFLAFDHKNASEVAVKFMKTDLGGTARRRFFREFNTIAGIEHPCCLRVFEIGETNDGPFFTMELHAGQSCDKIMGEPPAAVAPLLVDLTLAVDYIHSQGIVHRDIKPSNLLVQRTGDLDHGRLTGKLADFGLAKFYQLDSSLTAERGFVGTAAYSATEQIDGTNIDHRVDLYAIGILAFELLSGGRHPFAEQKAQGAQAVLNAHLTRQPPRLCDVNPNISAELSDVVGSYLAKEPELRPSSALPLRNVLCQAFEIEVEARLAQLSSPSEVKLNAVGFVCRDRELQRVDQFLHRRLAVQNDVSSSDSAPLLLFSGEPGTGKSSTMQEAVRRAVGNGFMVFEGRCFDGSTTSFQPIIEIIRQLLTKTSRVEQSSEESTLLVEHEETLSNLQRMREIVQSYKSELLLIAPELRRWLAGEKTTSTLASDSEYIFRALATMFVELSAYHPLCFCIDDLQWADQSTLVFWRHFAAAITDSQSSFAPGTHSKSLAPESGCPPIALLGTGRSGYTSLKTFCERMETQSLIETVNLELFSRDETTQLLALRLGALAPSISNELVDSIDNLCQGNPFFISETIREWYSRGLVVRTQDGWQRVHKSLDDDSSVPSTVRTALRTRLTELSEPSQLLVPAAAVLGREVNLDLLSKVVPDVTETQLLDAADELLEKRIFVETASASRMAFTHDLLRELILAELSASRQRSYHRLIVTVMEEIRKDKPAAIKTDLLARHCIAADLFEKGFQLLLETAERACQSYLFENAIEFLQLAQRHQPEDLGAGELYKLYSLLAISQYGIGDTSGGIEQVSRALQHTDDHIEKAQMHRLAGRYACGSGDDVNARKHLDKALTYLGFPRSQSLLGKLFDISAGAIVFHAVPRKLARKIARPGISDEQRTLTCLTLMELNHATNTRSSLDYLHVGSLEAKHSRFAAYEGLNAFGMSKYACNLAFLGFNRKLSPLSFSSLSPSVRFAKKAIKEIEDCKTPEIKWCTTYLSGIALYCAALLDEAEFLIIKSEPFYIKSRNANLAFCYHFLRHIHSVRGTVAQIVDYAEKELRVAETLKDTERIGWALFGLTHGLALRGDFEDSLKSAEESSKHMRSTESNFQSVALMEKGFALMQQSRHREAKDCFAENFAFMKRRFAFLEVNAATFPRMVEACLSAEWHNAKNSDEIDLRTARKYLRLAKIMSYSYPNIGPHRFRVEGRFHIVKDNKTRAFKLFERAITEADRIGAKYEKARTLIDLGVAFPYRAECIQQGLDLLDSLGAIMPEAELESAGIG